VLDEVGTVRLVLAGLLRTVPLVLVAIGLVWLLWFIGWGILDEGDGGWVDEDEVG
jgi:hypothetical protein